MSTILTDNCTIRNCERTIFSRLANNSHVIFEVTDTPIAEILKLAFEVLIALCGVIGNILVIIVTSKLGKQKNTADFYIQNLAIADLGTLLLTIPLAAIKEKAPYNWPLGEFICLYLYPVPEIFYGASVWCIAVIAIERYHKIVTMKRPGQSKGTPSRKIVTITAACVWIISFLLFCLPLYFVVEYHELPNEYTTCGPVWPSWDRKLVLARGYIALLTLLSYIVPLATIFFTYLAISRAIHQSSLFIKTMKQEPHDAVTAEFKRRTSLNNFERVRLSQNKRAKKILTPVVLVFAGTMLPLTILRLTIVFWPVIAEQEYYKNLLYAVSVFVILNSSANPVIYSIVSKNFRERIKNSDCHSGRISVFFRRLSLSSRRTSSRRLVGQPLQSDTNV